MAMGGITQHQKLAPEISGYERSSFGEALIMRSSAYKGHDYINCMNFFDLLSKS